MARNNRRNNSRSPLRNRLRRSSDSTDRVGKTKSKKAKKKLIRDQDSADRIQGTIAYKIKKVAEVGPSEMTGILNNLRSTYSTTPVRDGIAREGKSLESDSFSFKAYQYHDGANKLLISDLGRITDPDFGVVDTINAIRSKTEFKNESPLQILITTKNEQETRELMENIEAADPDLLENITFVRDIEKVRSGGSIEVSTDDSSQTTDNNNIPGKDISEPIVMDVESFQQLMGSDPKRNFLFVTRSKNYKAVVEKLEQYHTKLDNFSKILDKSGDDKEIRDIQNDELNILANELILSIDTYNKESKVKKSESEKDVKKDAMQILKDQLFVTQQGGTNTDVLAMRAAYWVKNFKALTDDLQTDQPGTLLGKGAHGEVYSKIFRIPGDGGQIRDFEAGVKIDDFPEYLTDPQLATGIPLDDPGQAKRSFASYEINRILGMESIPETRFLVKRDEITGKPEFGQAMDVVHGTPGQVTTRTEAWDMDKITGYTPGDDIGEFAEYDEATKTIYGTKRQVVDLDLSQIAIQKGLSDLQLLDNIIGHADRHEENFIFETAGGDSSEIIGVKGIDNDDTFGELWKITVIPDDTSKAYEKNAKTTGLPPVLDVGTVLNLLQNEDNFIDSLDNLSKMMSDDEKKATLARFRSVKKEIIQKVKDNELAASPGETFTDKQLAILAKETGRKVDDIRINIKYWGNDTIHEHSVKNSYLGAMQSRLDKDRDGEEGVAVPVFK